MADRDLNILIRLNDELSSGLSKVSNALDDFGRHTKTIGREIKEVGQTMTLVGASITGPFALAFANAAQNSGALNEQLMRLNNVAQQFQKQVAQSVLPVVQTFVRVVENLFGAFNSLNPAFRDQFLQAALLTGVFVTLGGIFTSLVGQVLKLVSTISSLAGSFLALAAANPMLLVMFAAIVGIVAAMFKWKGVADTIASTFEVVFRFIVNGLHTVELAIGKMVEAVLNGLLFIVDGLAKIPGPTQQAFQGMADQIRQSASVAKNFADNELQAVLTNTQKIGEVITTGKGEWSTAFDGFKQGVSQAIDFVRGLGQETEFTKRVSAVNFKQFAQDAKGALGTLQSSLQGAAAVNKQFAVAAQAVSIAMAIINTAEGVTKAFSTYPWPFSMAIAGIISAAGAIQIATIAAQKFHTGGVIRGDGSGLASDEVPIVAQTGEGILSRRGLAALGEANLNLLNSGRGLSNAPSGGSTQINIYIESPRISSSQDVERLGEDLGFAIDRSLRTARGF